MSTRRLTHAANQPVCSSSASPLLQHYDSVPVTEAVVSRHSWGKPAAFAGMPVLKCGTQQATPLPCGAGMVSTERSCWACGGVGNLAYEAPAERREERGEHL
ncbi:hypothetical protein EYF80_016665 [Liparis tanakae]|uniref:Uncharacterized protein n=1 Tax=Liparis tanakae TaxID=230148 RepID=A0A4Z2I543_9TELE|nr:hypothetical protein EYF80_016665 [Liparis tanakae]